MSQLSRHTAHLVDLSFVYYAVSPIVTFQVLRVRLPLSQESDLCSSDALFSYHLQCAWGSLRSGVLGIRSSRTDRLTSSCLAADSVDELAAGGGTAGLVVVEQQDQL